MKYKYLLSLLLSIPLLVLAQNEKEGINYDPYSNRIGEIPYETEGRKDEFIPTTTFDDCTKWIIKTSNMKVEFYRTQEERVFSEYSGKVKYQVLAPDAWCRVELKEPILLKNEWDCIEFWNYGDHWCWEENAMSAMIPFVVIEDAHGEEHIMPIMQAGYGNLAHKYWFLNHFKLNVDLAMPTKFVGYVFSNNVADVGVEHSIYLGNTYIFKEDLKPFDYKEFPKKLPFPLRKETIAPSIKMTNGLTRAEKQGNNFIFNYLDSSFKLAYELTIDKPFGDITLTYNGKSKCINRDASIIFENEKPVIWQLLTEHLRNDTLLLTYKAQGDGIDQMFKCSYYMHQKSLVWTIEELGTSGKVAEIALGSTDVGEDAQLISVPFLVYEYWFQRPQILYDGDLFHFSIFDWYYTNASTYYAQSNGIADGRASYNGGVRYIPLLNGKRNLLKERLFINVSDDVQEVFPTIDNPASPMRELQANRLWNINYGSNLTSFEEFSTTLRSKGIEKISSRYHECLWREGGESYTFRTEPNPQLGVERLQNFVRFIQSKDWRVGFYSNYTDFSPLSKRWNRDWVKMGPQGEWQISWSRNYAPKPHIAWEQQAILAPQIQKNYGTNHSYCDVHTSVPPMSRVDYDERSPGAGMMRSVFQYYGMLLLNERRSYLGPIYSEGDNHWWYAGLVDGNYGKDKLKELPVFPDFQLLKIHPLEMDVASTAEGDEYLAYALAYGHIGMLCPSINESIRRYAMLQPLQNSYSMIAVETIRYSDGTNFFTSSEAIKLGLLNKARLYIKYKSGLEVFVNFNDKDWLISNDEVTLPRFGFYARLPESKLISSSSIDRETGVKVDRVYSSELFYFSSGDKRLTGSLAGKGTYMLKKEKFNWEIIPVENSEVIEFDLNLMGYNQYGVDIMALDKDGNSIEKVNDTPLKGRVEIFPKAEHYKYKMVPVVTLN